MLSITATEPFAALRLQRYKNFLTYANKYTNLFENAANYLHISKKDCPFATILRECVNL